jgi:hypothetical protein
MGRFHRHKPIMKKLTTLILVGALTLVSTNCTTTYDAYGNPRQSVDPGTAAAGVAAAGVLGYALARDRNKNKHSYHQHGYHRGGYYDRYGRYRRY